jgi:dUTP pyrophosphatase
MARVKYVEVMLGENGKMPFRKYAGDAGHDLYVSNEAVIPPHTTMDVHTNIRIKMPPFIFARIIGRSSTLRKHGLMVNEGIIDNGYTGELFISVHNMTNQPFHVTPGMRLAQVIFHLIEDIRWSQVEDIPESHNERNDSGFGSTGV